MHVSNVIPFRHQSPRRPQLIDRLRVQEPVQRQLDAAAVGSPHHLGDHGTTDGFSSSASSGNSNSLIEHGHSSPASNATRNGTATADASTGTDGASASGDHSAANVGSSPAVRTLPPPLAWEVRKTSTSSHVPDRTTMHHLKSSCYIGTRANILCAVYPSNTLYPMFCPFTKIQSQCSVVAVVGGGRRRRRGRGRRRQQCLLAAQLVTHDARRRLVRHRRRGLARLFQRPGRAVCRRPRDGRRASGARGSASRQCDWRWWLWFGSWHRH
jgi:hypothetical protein